MPQRATGTETAGSTVTETTGAIVTETAGVTADTGSTHRGDRRGGD